MNEILEYIKAIGIKEAAKIETMKTKFKNKNVEKIIKQLLEKGEIWEPQKGIYRYLK